MTYGCFIISVTAKKYGIANCFWTWSKSYFAPPCWSVGGRKIWTKGHEVKQGAFVSVSSLSLSPLRSGLTLRRRKAHSHIVISLPSICANTRIGGMWASQNKDGWRCSPRVWPPKDDMNLTWEKPSACPLANHVLLMQQENSDCSFVCKNGNDWDCHRTANAGKSWSITLCWCENRGNVGKLHKVHYIRCWRCWCVCNCCEATISYITCRQPAG